MTRNKQYEIDCYDTTRPERSASVGCNVLRPESLLISPMVTGVTRTHGETGGMSCRPTPSPTSLHARKRSPEWNHRCPPSRRSLGKECEP